MDSQYKLVIPDIIRCCSMSRVGVSHDETRLMIWPSTAAITQVRYKINGYGGGGGVVVVVNDRENIAFLVAESGRRSSSYTHTHTHCTMYVLYHINIIHLYYVNIIYRPVAHRRLRKCLWSVAAEFDTCPLPQVVSNADDAGASRELLNNKM